MSRQMGLLPFETVSDYRRSAVQSKNNEHKKHAVLEVTSQWVISVASRPGSGRVGRTADGLSGFQTTSQGHGLKSRSRVSDGAVDGSYKACYQPVLSMEGLKEAI